jgi:hypothetical protein
VTTPTREQALAHFGVKGMKWGIRKATPGGTLDRVVFGKRGAANIASRVSSGQSASKARLVNSGRAALRAALVLYGALVARNVVRTGATLAVQARNSAKFANAGKAAMPAIMATASKLKYAPMKGGAFVITTMK